MIKSNGWSEFCIWEHSRIVRELYLRRSRKESEEMTAHAQAADLLVARVSPGDTILDIGCGSGYFFHSLRSRGIDSKYWGIDAAPSLINIGRNELPKFGLPPERLNTLRIEDLTGEFDHVVCINVLSNIDNFHKPLERLLRIAKKTVILRESLKKKSEYNYVRDTFLDEGVDLKVYVNHYGKAEILDFINAYGFSAQLIKDIRTRGLPEIVIGHPHYWTFVLAEKG